MPAEGIELLVMTSVALAFAVVFVQPAARTRTMVSGAGGLVGAAAIVAAPTLDLVVFVLLAGPIISIFTSDPAILPWGTACLRIVSVGFVFYAYGMVLSNALNGAGDTWTPTILNAVCFWVWEVPLAWGLSRLSGLGPRGVFVAITVGFSTLALLSAWVFRRGRWKTRAV